jgi:hypothetical protein
MRLMPAPHLRFKFIRHGTATTAKLEAIIARVGEDPPGHHPRRFLGAKQKLVAARWQLVAAGTAVL